MKGTNVHARATLAEIILAFRGAMHSAGIAPPNRIEPDGALHRFHVEGDRIGSLNGWYLLHLDGRAAGAFGSWRTGAWSKWSADSGRESNADREAFAALIAAAHTRPQAERRAEHEARAIEARRELLAMGPEIDPQQRYALARLERGVEA